MNYKTIKYGLTVLFVTVISNFSIWSQPNTFNDDSIKSNAENTQVYSSFILNESNFNEGFIVSPFELIAGKIPGVTIVSNSGMPGSSFSITTNGLNNFSNAESPVIVINGIPIYNTTVWLHPNEIESITFYKNAGALGYYNDKASNTALIIQTKKGGDKISVQYSGTMAISYLPEKVDVLTASEFRQIGSENLDSTFNAGNSDMDWQNEIFQQAISQDHHLSVSGTIPYLNLPVHVSAGKTIHEGIIKTSKLDRTTTTLAITPVYFDEHLGLNFNFDFNSFKNTLANEYVFMSACRINPTFTADEYNSANFFKPSIVPTDLMYKTNTGNKGEQYNMQFGVDYRFHFLPELSIGFNYSHQKIDNRLEYYSDTNTFSYSNWKEISQQDIINRTLKASLGYMHVNKVNKNYMKIAITQYYYENETESEEEIYFTSSGFAKDWEKSIYNLRFRIMSFDYGMHNKYFLNLYLRNENAEIYKENEDLLNSWGGGLGWKLTEENFLASQSRINNLVLRTSLKVPVKEDNSNTLSTGLNEEKQRYFDVGIDYSLFENKLTGYLQYIDKKNTELHQTIIVPNGSFFGYYLDVNWGEVCSRSVEFYLSSLLISREQLQWNIGTHLSYNYYNIKTLVNSPNDQYAGTPKGEIGGVPGGRTIQILKEDQPPYAFYTLQQVYDGNGKPLEGIYSDLTPDDTINYDDYRAIGQITPKVILGISSEFKYKDWEFYFSGRLHAGQSVYNNKNALSYYEALYYYNVTTNVEETKFNSSQIYSDYYVENASFFRMDYIGVAYAFQNLAKGIGNLRINATLQNAFTITSYSGLDPEVSNGIDYYQYPRARTFSIGVQLGF